MPSAVTKGAWRLWEPEGLLGPILAQPGKSSWRRLSHVLSGEEHALICPETKIYMMRDHPLFLPLHTHAGPVNDDEDNDGDDGGGTSCLV